jgi:hypothetical protein
VDGSQTVCDSRVGAFSSFPSSKPVDLDLNTTWVLAQCEVVVVADLRTVTLQFALNIEWRRNPSVERE